MRQYYFVSWDAEIGGRAFRTELSAFAVRAQLKILRKAGATGVVIEQVTVVTTKIVINEENLP